MNRMALLARRIRFILLLILPPAVVAAADSIPQRNLYLESRLAE
jgi:hypothetical protein